MAHKSDFHKLRHRKAEEVQLLAEQKWIQETLAKIKTQRNCLQIERLHLESVKAKLKPRFSTSSSRGVPTPPPVQVPEEPVPSTSAVNLMQNATIKSGGVQNEFIEKELDNSTCNDEELNLGVTNQFFNRNQRTDFYMEEDIEEEDDDDMFIDMNMLMNGGFK